MFEDFVKSNPIQDEIVLDNRRYNNNLAKLKKLIDQEDNFEDNTSTLHKLPKKKIVTIASIIAAACLTVSASAVVIDFVYKGNYSSMTIASEQLERKLITVPGLRWNTAYLTEYGNVGILQAGGLPDDWNGEGRIEINTRKDKPISLMHITALIYNEDTTDVERENAKNLFSAVSKASLIETFHCNALDRDIEFHYKKIVAENNTSVSACGVLNEDNCTFIISLLITDEVTESELLDTLKEICETATWTDYIE